LADEEKYGKEVLCEEDIAELSESFMEMWGLDVGEDMITTDAEAIVSGKENFGITKARESATVLVLKPQREGEGNNVYKEALPTFLPRMRDRHGLIQPPDRGKYLVRAGSTGLEVDRLVKAATVSELGDFRLGALWWRRWSG
jgi:glutathione synthase